MSGRGNAQRAFVNGIPVINNLDAAQNYAVNLDRYETLTQSLYDSALYPGGGAAAITFFQLPVGSGVSPLTNQAKTIDDTNMQAAGSMPAMQAYVVTSIEVDLQPAFQTAGTPFPPAGLPGQFGGGSVAGAVNDAWLLRNQGWLNFNIGSKSYMTEGPLMKFPASNDFEIDAAMANASTPASNQYTAALYGKAVGPAYVLSPNNLLLIPNQNFAVVLNWSKPVSVSYLPRLFVRLMGQLLRAAQ